MRYDFALHIHDLTRRSSCKRNRVDPKIVKAIVKKIDMISIVKQDVKLTYGIKNAFCICPIHKENTPSMNFNGEYYRCFGCGESGNVIHWIMLVRKWSFIKTIRHLSNISGIPLR